MAYKDPAEAKAYQKNYWVKNKHLKKEKGHKYWLRSKHDISVEDYNLFLVHQNFSCAFCKKHMSEFKQRLAVDHCHSTGKIRGLLCMHCNTALGQLGDSVEAIESVLVYLKNASV